MFAKDYALKAITESQSALDSNEVAARAHLKPATAATACSELHGNKRVKAKAKHLAGGRTRYVYYVREEQVAGMHDLHDAEYHFRGPQKSKVAPAAEVAKPVEMLLSMPVGNGTIQVTYDEGRSLFLALKKIYEPGRG